MKKKFFVVSWMILWLSPMFLQAKVLSNTKPLEVFEGRLKNGMRVVILRDPLAPVVATMMNYEVGSDQSPPGFPGMAHAQEHMMFRGTKNLSADQYATITAITGGIFDAETQNTVTQYYYVMPAQYLDIALHLEADRAENLEDSQLQWNEERGAIEQEVTGDYSNPEFRLFVKMQRHLLRGTPDADTGLGTVPSFNKTTASMLKNFYKTYYHPNNAVFVIAGDVNPKETFKEVEKFFGKIPPAPIPKTNYGKTPQPLPAVYRTKSDLPYTAIIIGYLYPSYHDKDWAASQILADVLSSQRGPLYDLVAHGKALDVSFYPNTLPYHGTAYAEIDVPIGEKPEEALKTLEAAIDAYKKDGVPADLVEAAKKHEIANAAFNADSIFGLASAWSQAIAVEGRRSPFDDVRLIEKVTPQDVTSVLRKYLDNKTAVVGYAIPNLNGKLSMGHGKALENNKVVPKGPVVLPSWASKILSHLHVPKKSIHPVLMHLPNGIALIVQEERETPTIVLQGFIENRDTMQTPKGKMGVSAITSKLLSFGTTTYNRLQYQAEIDKISANIKLGTSFSLSILSRYFNRGVQLLADGELHPAFLEKDFNIVKMEELGAVKGNVKSPDFLASLALMKALFPPDDPEQRHSTPKSVEGLSLEDVKNYYSQVYRPDMCIIAIVGDITPEKAKETIMHYFGDWKAAGPKPNVFPPLVPNNKSAFQVVPDPSRIQDKTTLAETLSLTFQNKDYPVLTVANAILGGGFYASLLYHDLREVKGYVYYVESNLEAGKTRSIFSISYGCMPDKVQPAKGMILSDLKEMQTRLVSLDRLQDAKALLLGRVPLREQSYAGLGRQLAQYVFLGLPLDEDFREAKAELAVTRSDIRNAMQKWIRLNDFVEVVQGPAPR
jgi:zinc protease